MLKSLFADTFALCLLVVGLLVIVPVCLVGAVVALPFIASRIAYAEFLKGYFAKQEE